MPKNKGTRMVPPKLSVVPQDASDAREDEFVVEADIDPSEVLAHEGWRGLPSNVTHAAVRGPAREAAHPGGAAVCRLRAAGGELSGAASERQR